MTVQDAIAQANRLRPNTHENEDKVAWLGAVESNVVKHINLHEGDRLEYSPITAEDMNRELLITDEHVQVYVLYLIAMYDYYNGDIDRYNNGAQMFGNAMEDWKAEYRRTHMPRRFEGSWNEV